MPGSSWDEPDDAADDGGLDSFDYLSSHAEDDDADDDWSAPPPVVEDHDDDWSAPPPVLEAPAAGADESASEESTEPAVLLFSVTNPAGTITAKAAVSGRIQRIELSPDVVSMTESALIRDVVATARLANLKGRSAQYSLIEGILNYQGLDRETAREFLDQHLDLPTPEQAAEAEADARTRYLRGDR